MTTSVVIPERVAERAATRYVEDAAGCHISTYSVGSHGYAQIGWWSSEKRKNCMTTAHRAAYQYHYGDSVLSGFTVDHLCHVRECVRREHLRLLSNRDNARRNSATGDFPLDAACKNNHDPEQMVTRSRLSRAGKRVEFKSCGECIREAHARYRAKRKAA